MKTLGTVARLLCFVTMAGCAAAGDEPPLEETSAALSAPHNLGGAATIRNNATSQCLEVLGNSILPHAPVVTTPCNGGLNQQWLVRYHPACLDPAGLLCSDIVMINVGSGLCLDVPGGVIANGLQQYSCNYGDNQRFSIGLMSGSPGGTLIESYAAKTSWGAATGYLNSPGANTNVRIADHLTVAWGFFWSGIPY